MPFDIKQNLKNLWPKKEAEKETMKINAEKKSEGDIPSTEEIIEMIEKKNGDKAEKFLGFAKGNYQAAKTGRFSGNVIILVPLAGDTIMGFADGGGCLEELEFINFPTMVSFSDSTANDIIISVKKGQIRTDPGKPERILLCDGSAVISSAGKTIRDIETNEAMILIDPPVKNCVDAEQKLVYIKSRLQCESRKTFPI